MKSHTRGAMRGRAGRLALAAFCLAGVAACRQDMHNQPKYRPLRATAFFGDGSSARPHVEGTVARGTLHEDQAFFTGKNGNTPVDVLPIAVDAHVLARGQERFNIYCTPEAGAAWSCSAATGSPRRSTTTGCGPRLRGISST
jgi:hypothetical protein